MFPGLTHPTPVALSRDQQQSQKMSRRKRRTDTLLYPPRESGCPTSTSPGEKQYYNTMKIFQIFNNYTSRYQEEFLELAEIASGEFGVVKKARHRLDGMIYAIKVSKKAIRKNSHDEKMAMNEVFAHAALMKHKHVVRYYNSWVESGAVSFKYF